ncbi:MAG: heavy-metal-associated domain-containing protein [Bacillota bacterium]
MTDKTLNVKGMTCEGYVNSIERTLETLQGVQIVKVNLSRGKVNISIDEGTIDVGKLKTAIEETGYEVLS